jgi:hypothetical protein
MGLLYFFFLKSVQLDFHFIAIFMEKLIHKENPQTTVSYGVWFLRNWPTVRPEEGT